MRRPPPRRADPRRPPWSSAALERGLSPRRGRDQTCDVKPQCSGPVAARRPSPRPHPNHPHPHPELVGARAPPARGRLALAHVCHQHCLLGCVCGGIADGITAGTLVAWMARKSRPPAGSTALQLARLHLRTDGHGLHLCLGHEIGGSRGFAAGTCGSSGCGECSARGRDAGTRVERRLCHFGWVGGEPAAPWWWCEAHEGDKKGRSPRRAASRHRRVLSSSHTNLLRQHNGLAWGGAIIHHALPVSQ